MAHANYNMASKRKHGTRGEAGDGAELMRLIDGQAPGIARREAGNNGRMRLYRAGRFWHGFERSAYFLEKAFPGAEAFAVRHPGCPSPIAVASVPEERLREYRKGHRPAREGDGYEEYEAGTPAAAGYGGWHAERTKLLEEAHG